jgi:DNA-binding response OmpR family regulator
MYNISKVPVIFMSSMSDNMNIVMAINMGGDDFIDDNTLTVNVTRLRKKLEQAGLIDYIKTKKGPEYRQI